MKSRIIVTLFHILHLTFTTYASQSFRTPSSFLFPIYWLTVLLSLSLFFYTSLSDPGRLSTQKLSSTKPEMTFHHQQSSLGSILTSSSNLNQVKTAIQGVVNPGEDLPRDIALNPISESLDNHESRFDSVSVNLDVISDEDNPSLIQNQPAEKEKNARVEPVESVEVSVSSEKQVKNTEKEKFDYSYCTICYIDQPLRTKHCKECGACIALFDHHCPFVDNCIGEKNKVWFFWMVFALAAECWITFAELVGGLEKNENFSMFWKKNWMNLIGGFLPFFLGILLGFLWIYHCYLAVAGLTTFEVIKRESLHYLENGKKNPFDKGSFQNLAYFCRPCKEVTVWVI